VTFSARLSSGITIFACFATMTVVSMLTAVNSLTTIDDTVMVSVATAVNALTTIDNTVMVSVAKP